LILNSLSLYLSKKPMLLHWDIKDVDEKLSRTSVLILTRKLQ